MHSMHVLRELKNYSFCVQLHTKRQFWYLVLPFIIVADCVVVADLYLQRVHIRHNLK